MVVLREKEYVEKEDFTGREKSRQQDLPEQEGQIRSIGFAVDIGTTTVVVAGYAYGAEGKCRCLGKKSEINAQKDFGKDVMMRIMHATLGKAEELHQRIIRQVETLATRILDQSKILLTCPEGLPKMDFVVVGNTTMCHLFLGEKVDGLRGAPFQPAYRGNQTISGKKLGFEMFPEANVFVLSGIASHVGSDALSVIWETKMVRGDKNILAVDLGTNAEIILNAHGKTWCCSAAAGPAFEGRGVSGGKMAGPGVITGFKMAPNTGNLILEIFSGEEITGICGSGLVDVLAELKKNAILQKNGRLISRDAARTIKTARNFMENIVELKKGERAFLIFADQNRQIFLTQTDIRNLQLAKAAIKSAMEVLLRNAGIDLKDVDTVVLSGVLGSNIRLENAMRIGLLPKLDKSLFHPVGNAALEGAVSLLKSESDRKRLETLALKITHVELADEKKFQELFLNSMDFVEN